jgi:hypothetical protein
MLVGVMLGTYEALRELLCQQAFHFLHALLQRFEVASKFIRPRRTPSLKIVRGTRRKWSKLHQPP